MPEFTESHENAMNSVRKYTHNFAKLSESQELLHERFEREFTEYDAMDDLGGVAVYFKRNAFVAFYDYEMQLGHVFTEAVQ